MTDFAIYKALPAQERDDLGFARWQELQSKLKQADQINAAVQTALAGHKPDDRDPDDLYTQAVEIVRTHQKASISLVQRHLKIGYNRAACLLGEMEKAGLISAPNYQGQRMLLPAIADERKTP